MVVRAAHRFTVEDYYRMAETGVIKPDARVELLEGEIIDMSAIGPWHGGVVNRLTRLFIEAAKGRSIVAVQNSIGLSSISEPQPDLVLLKLRADDYASELPVPADALLLIEVADSTLDYDRNVKIPAYGKAGIPEVWIVNLPQLIFEVYREPHFTGYTSVMKLQPGNTARPLSFPDVAVDVDSILRQVP
jgi:Uma2 family endonuclease